MLDEFVNQVIVRLKAASDYVNAKREKISREAGRENVRKQREHALAHPHLSSTPLPEALDRANNVLWKLEREAAPLVKAATAALLAVDQASREVQAVETAINNKRASERSAAAGGLYKEAVRVVDKLAEYGAQKWVLRQQSATEIRIFADLMRWKARDHEHDDPNSPWHMVFAGYRDRQMDVEVDPGDRYGTSMPQDVADAMAAKRRASIRPTFDLSTPPIAGNSTAGDASEDVEAVRLPAKAPASMPDLAAPSEPLADEVPVTPPSSSDMADASDTAMVASTPVMPLAPETFLDVAQSIVGKAGIDKALWQDVGFPRGGSDYEAIVRNGEAAIARGSTTPHLVEFVQAARDRWPSAFLAKLKKAQATRLAEILAADPAERARYRAEGFEVSEG